MYGAFGKGEAEIDLLAMECFGEELTAIEALAIGAFFETNPLVASNYTIFRFAAFMTDLKSRRNSLPAARKAPSN